MAETVYVALEGVIKEGASVLGVAATEDGARAICQREFERDYRRTDRLAWRDGKADHPDASSPTFYEVQAHRLSD